MTEFKTKPIVTVGEVERVAERERLRLEALALWNRYQRGEITRETYDLLVSDIDKEPDDLTRNRT